MNGKVISAGLLVCLVGMASLVGCVSAAKYNDAVAANDRCQAALSEAHEKLQGTADERGRLVEDMQACNARLVEQDRLIDNLTQSATNWEDRFNQLKERYDRDTQSPPPQPVGPILPAPLDERLQAWVGEHSELVEYDRQRGMVKFKTDLLFAKGSDEVSTNAKGTLGKFAEIVKGAAAARFHIYIVGHTDDIPIGSVTRKRHPTNWYLSVHRAVSVKDVLAAAGVPDVRMGVMGFGEHHPIAANAPKKRGNPQNRRVEIWIVPPERFLTVSMP